MAKNMQPIAKRCKALGISPAVMGYAKKETNRNPGGQMRKKKSEYGIQLNEKQKVKFIYGILEKQFHSYYEAAVPADIRAQIDELKGKIESGEIKVSTAIGMEASVYEALKASVN